MPRSWNIHHYECFLLFMDDDFHLSVVVIEYAILLNKTLVAANRIHFGREG